uniref:Uncharacterized protein n=1 Tax=Anguilla anguilla TaxID=7936 RepID=A0A0E9PLL8_ANGAN
MIMHTHLNRSLVMKNKQRLKNLLTKTAFHHLLADKRFSPNWNFGPDEEPVWMETLSVYK